MSLAPEKIGDYQVVRELGRGGTGIVYLGLHPTLDRQVAIKVMAPELAAIPEFIERFRREGAAAARLRHPNIVQIFDFANRDGLQYIAMEYLGSRTLKDLIREGGQQPVERACAIVDELLSALSCAHANGVVHRDIKPANIMLTDAGTIALTDFSVAFIREASKLTQTGVLVGTPEYMAPEQFEGHWDARSDLYAAAIVFYELLVGFSPFRSETMTECMRKQLLERPDPPSSVDFTIPDEISRVVVRALEKRPADRFQSAEEMRGAVQQALLGSLKVGAPEAPESVEPIAPAPLGVEDPPAPASPMGPLTPLRSRGSATPALAPAPVEPEVSSTLGPPLANPEPPRGRRRQWSPLLALILVGAGTWLATRSRPPAPSSPVAVERLPAVTAPATPGPLATPSPATPSPAPSSPEVAPASLSATPTGAPPEDFFTPTPAPAVLTPSATPGGQLGTYPMQAEVVPGVGVGELRLGASPEEALAQWGSPLDQEPGEEMRWTYDGCVLLFRSERLTRIAITNPYFTLAESGLGIGSPYGAVRTALGQATSEGSNDLDYDDRGIFFHFGAHEPGETKESGLCNVLNVYRPGETLFAEP